MVLGLINSSTLCACNRAEGIEFMRSKSAILPHRVELLGLEGVITTIIESLVRLYRYEYAKESCCQSYLKSTKMES
jgi:hypothetical protein